ncbi:WLM domain-containing protein [Mycena belliarum]|uniref:WLM domain-containing protein n=1 Tax=Mycena belliarum TaxID=1033014 RepID=A0AAD6UL94_9AGAR|nr:WLM domain-containing protein [Mycena belliae]
MSNSSTDNFVRAFTHLKGRPKEERALPMLQRIASLVKPIMRKHGWVLPVLAEFFPAQDNLIDVNAGQKILLRLRPAHAPDTFYEEDDVVQTMLHELTHNVHGPHDERFYKFLGGLQDEYDALQRSGYSGEGFFSTGKRVGEGKAHDLPPHLARAKALEAAEKRAQTARVLGSGGRLGGGLRNIVNENLSPRERAAQAAERRARDEKACGSGALAQREAEKAANESIEHKVVDLTLDSDSDSDSGDSDVIIVDEPPRAPAAGPSKLTIPQSKRVAAAAAARPLARAAKSSSVETKPQPPPARKVRLAPTPAAAADAEWACRACTLLNGPLVLQCAACFSSRPPDETTGWTCRLCGEPGMPHDFWTCRVCGTVKAES